MDAVSFGQAGLQGWRVRVADAVATPVARHSGLSEEQARAAAGALFFVLSLVYVVGTIRRIAGGS